MAAGSAWLETQPPLCYDKPIYTDGAAAPSLTRPKVPMMHSAQATSIDRIDALRSATFAGQALDGGGHLQGDLFCDLDAETGKTIASFSSEPGSVLAFDLQVEGQPRWVVLRLELGEAQFQPGDVLGLALRGSCSHDCTIGVYLRMVREGGFTDTRFADSLRLGPNTSVRTAMHTLSAVDPAIGAPGGCALILGLPAETARFHLSDLHFFVMPAEEGLRSTPIDLSSFAA